MLFKIIKSITNIYHLSLISEMFLNPRYHITAPGVEKHFSHRYSQGFPLVDYFLVLVTDAQTELSTLRSTRKGALGSGK